MRLVARLLPVRAAVPTARSHAHDSLYMHPREEQSSVNRAIHGGLKGAAALYCRLLNLPRIPFLLARSRLRTRKPACEHMV